MKTYYMHLLDGKPAIFQHPHIVRSRRLIRVSEMAPNLGQIRREQKIARQTDEVVGDVAREYGHAIIRVDKP